MTCAIAICAKPASFNVYWRYDNGLIEAAKPTALCEDHARPHRFGRTGFYVGAQRIGVSPRMEPAS